MKKHVLQWHITHKCNLRCTHCYQNEYEKDLSLEKLEIIFNQYLSFLKKYDFKGHINFTGGEPFLYKDIFHLFDLCVKNNITFGILTNGTLLNDDIVKKLSNYSNLSFVQISIDGTKETHDAIRGKGMFELSLKNLKKLQKYKIQTMVSFTCHKHNYKELENVIKVIKKNKVDRFWVDRLIPMGNNTENILTPKEYEEVIKLLTYWSEKCEKNPFCKTKIHTNRALQFCFSKKEIYHCSAGKSLLTILADGTLLPCRRLPLEIGNVLEKDLLMLFEESEIIKDLSISSIPEDCKGCTMANHCRGGAKCLSYALKNNYKIKDSYCNFKNFML